MVESKTLGKRENQFARGSDLRKRPRIREAVIVGFLFVCGALSILTTIGIVYELGSESRFFFTRTLWENTNHTLTEGIGADDTKIEVSRTGSALQTGMTIRFGEEVMRIETIEGTALAVRRGLDGSSPTTHDPGATMFAGERVTLREFFTGTRWNPQIGEFGILPLINATLMTSFIAMLVALPLGLSVAIYLSEYASQRMRSTLKPVLEVLAGIPTVVYGYFALTFMTPILRGIFGRDVVEIYNTASAGIVIGILILPLVSSMSEDALTAVPRSLREAAYGLGATRLETAVKVVVPAAFSGIAAAFIVAVSRAIGETMIVAIAAGAGPSFTFNPFESAETMTGHIVRISGGDLSYNSIDYNSIFAIGLVLFFMTLTLNIISQRVVKRYREVYE
ncbi:MAG: phosphate ABC transporter permease subunit PstC [Anaerolineales bacterium]|jgi:phosphate transport system permease protein